MKIVVTGGREYTRLDTVRAVFGNLAEKPKLVIHGGARGADSLCEHVAHELGIPTLCFKPDWDLHGKKAGVLRNQEMVDYKPDLLLAFPGGVGTADMKRRCAKANIPMVEIA